MRNPMAPLRSWWAGGGGRWGSFFMA